MRVVLDTNVFLVAISRKTPYYLIFNSLMNGEYELCVTTDILNEYAELLAQKFSEAVMHNTMKAIEKSPDILWNVSEITYPFGRCLFGADFVGGTVA